MNKSTEDSEYTKVKKNIQSLGRDFLALGIFQLIVLPVYYLIFNDNYSTDSNLLVRAIIIITTLALSILLIVRGRKLKKIEIIKPTETYSILSKMIIYFVIFTVIGILFGYYPGILIIVAFIETLISMKKLKHLSDK
jgi:hypothetical protein